MPENESKKLEILNKLNSLLEEDPQFRNKFADVFDTEEQLTFQVAGVVPEAEAEGGCSCRIAACGKGCFASYPGARGHVVG
jgi:hypothetical protein